MRYFVLILLSSGCAGTYIELQHNSTYPHGAPFNARDETTSDTLYVGRRFRSDFAGGGLYASAAVGYRLRDRHYLGGGPKDEIVVGWEERGELRIANGLSRFQR